MVIINNRPSNENGLKRLFDEVAKGNEIVATVKRTTKGLYKITTVDYLKAEKEQPKN